METPISELAPRTSAAELVRIVSHLQRDLRDLANENAKLRWQLAEASAEHAFTRDSHRAALNLMNDAMDARRAERAENAERKSAEEQLRTADRRKDEFLATLAHELRNPLAPIVTSLRLLKLSDTGGESTRVVHEMLNRQMKHLVRLVDDLMEVSRITRGEIILRPEPVDLASMVRHAAEMARPLIDGGKHELTIDLPAEPVIFDADAVRLAQILANLLNNAAKYTEDGGRIAITGRRSDSMVEISVRDNGLGIPAEMLPRIFDLFTQVDRTLGRAQGGLGIGLTLVRTLVLAHGGTVEGKSDGAGMGSEFVVRLPAATRHSMIADSHAATAPHLG